MTASLDSNRVRPGSPATERAPEALPDDAVERILRFASLHPRAPAICMDGRTWTYGQLWDSVVAISRLIEATATDPQRPVALVMDRDARLFASMIAVVHCGRFFVVVDPNYPEARNRLVLHDADPSLLLHDGHHLAPPNDAMALQVASRDELSVAGRQRVAAKVPDPGDLACLVYTSGSTGRPKGVMLPRGALDQIARIQGSHIGILPGTRMSMLSSASVVGGMRTLWGGLPCGASIHPFSIEKEGLERFGQWLETERIETLHCTSSVVRHFSKSLAEPGRFPSVKTVIYGADRVLADDVAAARTVFAEDVQVWTGLGASETGTVTGRMYRTSDALPEGQMPLGPTVPGREVHLLDQHDAPVQPGDIGELIVDGPDLALGYWRQAERSAEVFASSPIPGWQRFRTGDLARVTPDGSLLHMGRKDFVVKVRGVRVDLGEVEAILARHATVRECAVIAFTAHDGEVRLIAFVQFKGEAAVDPLRDHVATALPPAMQPQRYVVVADWPRTVSGKLDRRALRPPEDTPGERSDLHDGVEQVLAAIWSEVLGSPVRSRDTHFFDAGGNSLSAMRVAARVASVCGKQVSPTALFATPRLTEFAAQVQNASAAQSRLKGSADAGALSPAQEALWFLEKLEGSSATYNISLPLRLTGPLDHGRLSLALEQLRRRHDALRIVIREVDGRPVQQLAPASAATPAVVSPMVAEPVDDDATLEQILRDESQRPVTISAGQLWRARLLRVGPQDHVLILVLHHVICDGWSLQLLADDLAQFYSSDIVAPATQDQVRLIDIAAGQRAHSRSAEAEASRKYWATRLAQLPELELPVDRPASAFVSSAGAIHRFQIPSRVSGAVRALSLRQQATPFMVHLAAFQLLLARISGSTDFGIGIPAADRPDADLERVVGYLVNTLVLRAPITESMTFRQLLTEIRQAVIEALAHQDIAFEQVVEDLAPVRVGNRNPLFQVAFAMQNQPRSNMRFSGLEAHLLETHNGSSKFDLTLEISNSDQGCWGEIEYRKALFNGDTIERLAGLYIRLLQEALDAPDAALHALPILGPQQRRQLIDWNATNVPRRHAQLHQLILKQCARTPRATAIVGGHESLTYAALAAAVESAASALRASGVRRGDPVGVLMQRSPRLIVTALAIMRAGAVYLPLDPEWPEQRRLTVARASGARLILRDEGRQWLADRSSSDEFLSGELAYILFTSGSMGAPKGVEILHRSICNHLLWFNECTGMSPADAMLFKTASTFDASLVEMFAPLLAGARVIIARDQGELDAEYLIRTIQEYPVTILQSVPTAYRTLLAAGGLSRCTSLRYLVVGGEAFNAGLARSLKKELPSIRIGNFYGPTEVTIDATQHEITDWDADVIPIGKPVANTRCHVLDSRGQLQPVGIWGELCVSGMGVARGYRNQPELTAASFVPDPFQAGDRMYRTGDRVRWRADGTLEFSGRGDGQIKVRGLRIELGEIEATLLVQQGVAGAVVVPMGADQSSVTALVAFVVARSDMIVDAAALRDALAAQLPRYMVPNRIVLKEFLPTLPSGKVDRAALTSELAVAETEPAAPRNMLESQLLELWREHLGPACTSIDGDFFELGGHSLLAFQLVTRIQQSLERPCTLRMLFRFPTIRQLAEALEADSRAAQGSIVLPLQGSGSRPPIYCICGVQLYRELAQHFGPDIPVHGVFLPWEEQVLESRGSEELSVVEMAQRYIQAIRAVQPQGPFSLVGISFGGILAFEIGRQLAAAGAAPPVVAVLDMLPVEARRKPRLPPTHFLRRAASWVRMRLHPQAEHDPMDKRTLMYIQAMQSYRTLPYAGRLLVVRATKRPRGKVRDDPALGWRQFAPLTETLEVPGDHLGILRAQGAGLIARALRQWLP